MNYFGFFFILISIHPLFGQKTAIEASIERDEALSHFYFLASDELKGRDPARMEIDIAAKYIAGQFEKYGAQALPALNGYFQYVPFVLSAPPSVGQFLMNEDTLTHGSDLLVMGGKDIQGVYEMVFAGYGMEDDYEGLDVNDKWVVVRLGTPGNISPSELLDAGKEKIVLAESKGAAGLLEMYNIPSMPWQLLVNYLNKPQMTVDPFPENEENTIPYVWMKDLTGEKIKAIEAQNQSVNIEIEGKVNRKIQGRNVVAFVEGTDSELKNEYIMLSAHYDHIGVGQPNAEGDSIYNGARDNAVGTSAIINAAKFFAENPPKRSVLLTAWTAEEKGLLGSGYFSENPPVDLSSIIYNLNIDNASYNDTSIVTVIGLNRTSADHHIKDAVSQFDLEAIPDPAPEQGLYDRSDNVNFAKKGIPAPTFSLGFTAFDQEVAKHYHQVTDQVDNFDLDYAMKYWKSYILSAQLIANDPAKPIWKVGDKYEEAGKQLYELGH